MIFFLVLVVAMFFSLVAQHFIGEVPQIGARVMLMPIVMFYGALALPIWGMLALAFVGGLMWDALFTQWATLPGGDAEGNVEIAMGWSIVLFGALGALMSGFRPLFQRGRWEIHCLLSGVCTCVIVLSEYLMITIRRHPVTFNFDNEIWWRIGGAGLVAALLSPLFFFALNYLASLVAYETQPERKPKR